MALVRERRQFNLRLPAETLRHRRAFLLPLPLAPSSSSSESTATSTALSEYKKLGVLGHGNGGTVYKVEHRSTGAVYALKLVHCSSDPAIRRRTLRERDILRRTDSPHVVRCHEIFDLPADSPDDLAILMEYMDSGTLDSELRRNGPFSEVRLASVARQVLDGLTYLHSKKIVHRDIKPSNLLINHKSEVKIADFGVSRIIARSLDPCNSYVGTCAYMSPERFDPDTYGPNYDGYAGDIWSLGLTLLELYLGHFPLLMPGQRPDWATLMCSICFGDPPTLPEDSSEYFRSFVSCCLEKEAGKRWSAQQLLTHPFLSTAMASR